MSKPASRKARALSSSLALHQMNSRMSGWSTSRTTIFAARRVPPPDLIEPAQASAPRMKLTGPDAVPPRLSGSIEPRILERLMPEPEPLRKLDIALLEGNLVAVADPGVPQLPLDRIERMLPGRREIAADREALARRLAGAEWGVRGVLHADLLLSFFAHSASSARLRDGR